jgi:hypothetical protein
MKQYAWTSAQSSGQPSFTTPGTPQVKFEAADSHNHFHLMRAMRYSLWNQSRTAQVAPGQKVGFCLYDIEHAPEPSPSPGALVYNYSVTHFCEQGNPSATSLRMGVSAGWRDVYDKSLAYQWVDVSNTTPGTYYVGAEADPDGTLWEGGGSTENNTITFASRQVVVPGWVATPVAATQTGGPQAITLASTKYGNQGNGNLRYRIVQGPAHGTLNVATGASTSSSQVTYTPAPGWTGPDTFTFAAYSASSSFPKTPTTATASIAASAPVPSLSISGAPTGLVAGTSAQLTANLTNLSGGVTWTATAGTVSPAGLFTAPAAPPAGGTAVVRATSATNPSVSAQVTIPILPAPALTAAPGVNGAVNAGQKLLSRLAFRVVNRTIVVTKIATGPKPGRLVMTTVLKRKVLGRCIIPRVGANKTVTCKTTMTRPYPLAKVRVQAVLVSRDGTRAVRRTYLAG